MLHVKDTMGTYPEQPQSNALYLNSVSLNAADGIKIFGILTLAICNAMSALQHLHITLYDTC